MDYLSNFIKPELLVLVPVLFFIGSGLKKCACVPDRLIPMTLGGIGVMMAVVYVLGNSAIGSWREALRAAFTALTQGVLCAGASVYVHQLIKQAGKKE